VSSSAFFPCWEAISTAPPKTVTPPIIKIFKWTIPAEKPEFYLNKIPLKKADK
jgi:hypothetical protein